MADGAKSSRIQASRCFEDRKRVASSANLHAPRPFLSSVSRGASGCFDGAVGLMAFPLEIHEIQKVTGRPRIAQRAVMRLEFDPV